MRSIKQGHRAVLTLALAAGTMLAAGCVTINIYFPAAAAEKAADRIIDDVWQLKDGAPAPKPGASAPAAPATPAAPAAK